MNYQTPSNKSFLLSILMVASIFAIVIESASSSSNVVQRTEMNNKKRSLRRSLRRSQPKKSAKRDRDVKENNNDNDFDNFDNDFDNDFGGHSRIVGGDKADAHDYPYFVEMGGCGGALIAPDVVLFAAHCKSWLNKQVSVGAYRKKSTEEGAVPRFCSQWIDDPEYGKGGSSINNDFALCKLDVPVETDASSVVTLELNLEASMPSPGDDLVVMGLGRLSSGGSTPDYLRDVTVPYLTNERCNDPTSYNGLITDAMLCAGFPELDGHADSCQGDSGGPIVKRILNDDGSITDYHVGVVSWGFGCADLNYPGVYARTSARADWIREAMCEDLNSIAPICNNDNTPQETCNGVELTVRLTTDAYGSETSWELKKDNAAADETVVDFRKYLVNYFSSEITTCLPNDGSCYEMEFKDAYGDGMCSNNSCGGYTLLLDGTEILVGDGDFRFSKTETFCAGEPGEATDSPTASPTPEPVICGGNANLAYKLELQTDFYGGETTIRTYEIDPQDTNESKTSIGSVYERSAFLSRTSYELPKDDNDDDNEQQDHVCLRDNACYVFRVEDTYGDGLTAGINGFYSGYLGGEQIISGDGKFDYEIEHAFCTGTATLAPEPEPTGAPTDAPSLDPTGAPSATRSFAPTVAPSDSAFPSESPFPTDSPTTQPTDSPTAQPTDAPTYSPTAQPTNAPSDSPTAQPTDAPTDSPTGQPTDSPTAFPTDRPTTSPSSAPSDSPVAPTQSPTNKPPACPPSVKDNRKFRYKGSKRMTCKRYVRGKKAARKCKSNQGGKTIAEWCPRTCGKIAGVGVCESLKKTKTKKAIKNRNNNSNNSRTQSWKHLFVEEKQGADHRLSE